MGMWNKTGSTSRGMLTMALAMALGPRALTTRGESGLTDAQIGERLMIGIKNHYRGLRGGTSNAASLKRDSHKRRNIAKHSRAARGH